MGRGKARPVPIDEWLFVRVTEDERWILATAETVGASALPESGPRLLAECRAKRQYIERARRWAKYVHSVAQANRSPEPHLTYEAVLHDLLQPVAMLYRNRPGYGHWR